MSIILRVIVIGHDVLEVGIAITTYLPFTPQRTVGITTAPALALAMVAVIGTTPVLVPVAPLVLPHVLVKGIKKKRDNARSRCSVLFTNK